MAFTFVAAVGNFAAGAGTTLDATASLNVADGDVLVAWAKHEGTNGTFAVAKTTGGNDFTFDAGDEMNHSNNDLNGSMGYLLSASADATFTPRLTTESKAFRALHVLQFRPNASETVTKDGSNKAQGNISGVSSGNITTTGTDGIAIGGFASYSSSVTETEEINGVSATSVADQDNCTAWYRIVTAGFTGAATASTGGGIEWICAAIAFKSEAGVVWPPPGSDNAPEKIRTIQSGLKW